MNHPFNIKYTKRKNSIALKIANNQVTVLAPIGTTYFTINDLLNKKAKWIQNKIVTTKNQELKRNELYLFGQKQLINFYPAKQNYFSLTPDQQLEFYYNKQLSSLEIKFLFSKWQQNFAHKYILARTTELIKLTKLSPCKIILKQTTSQWGSCSATKNISLCMNLLYTKKTVLDYVIIHELCHLKEMNHSKNFWQLVEKFCPNYKTEVEWLKKHNFLIEYDKELAFSL
ncbi:MAG: M48 family metallopeptidase [Alphaproteobacteria bacterium]|jgi:predicted metal-dependent hydrolase|nr:M48 family metallopeptidase [Alphaproteobacteria bacterium]MBT5827760.1 M48 family metallopeptidase [Alphaproteobacteria bacterium]